MMLVSIRLSMRYPPLLIVMSMFQQTCPCLICSTVNPARQIAIVATAINRNAPVVYLHAISMQSLDRRHMKLREHENCVTSQSHAYLERRFCCKFCRTVAGGSQQKLK